MNCSIKSLVNRLTKLLFDLSATMYQQYYQHQQQYQWLYSSSCHYKTTSGNNMVLHYPYASQVRTKFFTYLLSIAIQKPTSSFLCKNLILKWAISVKVQHQGIQYDVDGAKVAMTVYLVVMEKVNKLIRERATPT